jgi:hypothetical protein
LGLFLGGKQLFTGVPTLNTMKKFLGLAAVFALIAVPLIAGLAAAFALIAVPLSQASAKDGSKSHHRHSVKKPVGCPTHRTAEGEIVDCHGWRNRAGIGWDNSCFNLDYLPSSYACSSRGRW